MTTRLNPDGPKLELDGKPQEGDKLSDSAWEGLDEKAPDDVQKNLGRIARAQKGKHAPRTEG
jgi:hypothetical protein